MTADINRLEKNIYEQAGEEFNIASPKQLGIVLFEKMELVKKPKKTKTGQYATGEDILSFLAKEHEIIRNNYLVTVLSKSILLAFCFYGSLQISRDMARLIIFNNQSKSKGRSTLIYGAGSAGIELYHAIKNNPKVNIKAVSSTNLTLP